MDLLQNPFHILNATPRDNRRRIVELSDERSLLTDCTQARSDLTNPRKRLAAEIAWLPGISPKQAAEVFSALGNQVSDLLGIDNLTPIARANLLAAGLSRLPAGTPDDLAEWILELAIAFEEIDPEELCAVINEERIVSDFPEVTDLSMVETEIEERRRQYLRVIKSALDKLSSKELVEAITVAVKIATDNGQDHGPILIDDLVDAYEVEAQGFLDREARNIEALVEKIGAAANAERRDSTLAPLVSQLIQVVKNWDTVAQPIQVSTKSRGLEHRASLRIAGLVRDLAVHLFNEHGKLDLSQQLTNMLQEIFAEVVKVAERTAEDASALDDIAEQRKQSGLLDSISVLCKSALENSSKNPYSAVREAQRVIDAVPQLLSELSSANASGEIVWQGKNEIALTLMHCAVVFGNKTEKWKMCVSILDEAARYASSQEVKSRIQESLETVRNNVRLFDDLTRKPPPGPGHPETAGSGKRAGGSGWKWILVIISFVIVPVIVLAYIAWLDMTTPSYYPSAPRATATPRPSQVLPNRPTARQTTTYPAQVLPGNGAVLTYTTRECIAPLEIRASPDSHYLVTLADNYSNPKEPIMAIFVRCGMTANVDVPLGNYEFCYASGDTWYGYKDLFGPNTGYSKADKVLDFQRTEHQVTGGTEYQVTGHTVTLYKVINGNLPTSPISADYFKGTMETGR